MSNELAVELRGIHKRFGDNVALDDVDLVVAKGEVHGLLGENGAGKTTLMNVLTGLYRADEGEVRIKGNTVDIRTPRDAISHKVGMVHQHFELVQAFTAFDNIMLGASGRKRASDRSAQRQEILDMARHYGFSIDLDRRVADLEIGDQQKIEILRILYAGVDIMILDEPSTHLTPEEVDLLFEAVRTLAAEGMTVILIAHKLREVLSVVDRLTVLQRGRLAGTLDRAEADEAAIVAMMMGADRELPVVPEKIAEAGTQQVLRLEDVSAETDDVSVNLHSLNLSVAEGELVGIAGVAGNGQSELVEVIAGTRAITSGKLGVRHRDLTDATIASRIRGGIAVLPGDRIREGVLPGSPVFETYALGPHVMDTNRWSSGTWRERARSIIERFDVRTPSETVPTATLSGGNIQKVLVARALTISEQARGGVLVAMNPTSGLDVGAAAFVHEQLVQTCENGGGVLLISEDLDELLSICDRILVLSEGQLVMEQKRADFDRQVLGRHMVAAA